MSKTIITVQHTESEHHLNGHAGAWGDWSLTEKGRQQAFEIGKWLLNEGCDDGSPYPRIFSMIAVVEIAGVRGR